MEVTSLNCEFTPYTNCSMSMEAVNFKSFELVQKQFTKKNCTLTNEMQYQIKKRPECVKVKKNNCVTNWDYDSQGNKVSIFQIQVYRFLAQNGEAPFPVGILIEFFKNSADLYLTDKNG